MRGLPTLACFLLFLFGCASPPAPPDTAQQQPKAQQISLAGSVINSSDFTPPPGYKTRRKGGEKLYCRSTTVLGSRFPVEQCFTQTQIKEMDLANQATRDNLSQQSRICAGASCGTE